MSNPYQPHSETSKAAAESVKPDKGRAAVLACLRQHPNGLTDEEIQGLTGLSPSTERPRRVELWRSSAVFDSGERRKTRSGRSAVVWRIVPASLRNVDPRVLDWAVNGPMGEPIFGWKERALLAEATADKLRETIDMLQLELAKSQGRKQQQPTLSLGYWDDPRRSS